MNIMHSGTRCFFLIVKAFLILTFGVLPSVGFGEQNPRPAEEYEKDTNVITLDGARKIIAARESGEDVKAVGPIRLGGFNFTREIEISKNAKALIISCHLGGGIIVFDSTGQLVAFRRTGDIKSAQMFDIDQDGQDEIITDEVDGIGTGIGRDGYHIYRYSNNKLEQLWHGESYYLDAYGGKYVERQGFIRFMESGWGVPCTRLIHIVCDINGKKCRQDVYVLRDGQFTKIKGLWDKEVMLNSLDKPRKKGCGK